jgi:hypothetical protein
MANANEQAKRTQGGASYSGQGTDFKWTVMVFMGADTIAVTCH